MLVDEHRRPQSTFVDSRHGNLREEGYEKGEGLPEPSGFHGRPSTPAGCYAPSIFVGVKLTRSPSRSV